MKVYLPVYQNVGLYPEDRFIELEPVGFKTKKECETYIKSRGFKKTSKENDFSPSGVYVPTSKMKPQYDDISYFYIKEIEVE